MRYISAITLAQVLSSTEDKEENNINDSINNTDNDNIPVNENEYGNI